jgi:hypothetical protein
LGESNLEQIGSELRYVSGDLIHAPLEGIEASIDALFEPVQPAVERFDTAFQSVEARLAEPRQDDGEDGEHRAVE